MKESREERKQESKIAGVEKQVSFFGGCRNILKFRIIHGNYHILIKYCKNFLLIIRLLLKNML